MRIKSLQGVNLLFFIISHLLYFLLLDLTNWYVFLLTTCKRYNYIIKPPASVGAGVKRHRIPLLAGGEWSHDSIRQPTVEEKEMLPPCEMERN